MLRSTIAADARDDGPATAPADHLTTPVTQHQIPLLDLDKVREMESLIGENVVAGMLKMISAEIIEHVPEMIDALETGQLEQARHAAHRLKGAASLLGVPRLVDGLTGLEKTIVQGENIHPVINHLRQVATDTLRTIADHGPSTDNP